MSVESRLRHSQCPVCERSIGNGLDSFCPSHKIALDNIRKHYNEWVKAYGSLTKEEYLHRLAENDSAGEWVLEVAEYLLREGAAERL